MPLHHKEMFSHNDIEANNNNVTFKTHLSNSMGPALFVLALPISMGVVVLFVISLVTHWQQVVMLLGYGLYAIGGLALVLAVGFVMKTVWIWIGHALAEWSFSKAQPSRNSILSTGVNHVAYDSSKTVAVAQLAQHITTNQRGIDPSTIVDADQTQLLKAPSFHELTHAANGLIIQQAMTNKDLKPSDKQFVWGFSKDGPRIVKFGNVRSVAISGMNGTGKTVTLGFLSAQAALYGFELVLVDAHLGQEESISNFLKSLQTRMVCAPTNGSNCEQTFVMVANELKVRKANPNQTYKPWLFVIDELPGLIREHKRTNGELVSLMLETLTSLNDEGRKYGMFVIAAGQRWKQASSGSADFRQSFPAQIQHKNAAPEIELLLGCTATEALTGVKLQPGYVLMSDSQDSMVHMAIPMTTPDDIEAVSNIAAATYGGVSMRIVEIPTKDVYSARNLLEMEDLPLRNDNEMSWQAKRDMFRELLSQNATKSRYMTEIWNAKPGDNVKYNTFVREYDQMLQELSDEMEEANERIAYH